MAICPMCDGEKTCALSEISIARSACGVCRETGQIESDELAVLIRLASEKQLRKIRKLVKWEHCYPCHGTGRTSWNAAGYKTGPCHACDGKGRKVSAGEKELLRVFF